jgi:hypothetical protein
MYAGTIAEYVSWRTAGHHCHNVYAPQAGVPGGEYVEAVAAQPILGHVHTDWHQPGAAAAAAQSSRRMQPLHLQQQAAQPVTRPTYQGCLYRPVPRTPGTVTQQPVSEQRAMYASCCNPKGVHPEAAPHTDCGPVALGAATHQPLHLDTMKCKIWTSLAAFYVTSNRNASPWQGDQPTAVAAGGCHTPAAGRPCPDHLPCLPQV